MKVLDLFSGIGGFSLGLEAAGMQTVSFCEIDPFCQAVLKKHWPNVPCHDDVTKLDGRDYNGVDVICGGYPCQPFSVAGKQRGHEDERHLWPEMLRVIQDAKPRWVVAENVGGHIKLGFDEVASSLENEGFTVWSFIIPACAVGAPHKRDRVWIVAHSNSKRMEGCAEKQIQGKPNISLGQTSIVFPHTREQLDAFEPKLRGSNHGISLGIHRLKSLGNSIVPQIAEVIGKAIIAYESEIGTWRDTK